MVVGVISASGKGGGGASPLSVLIAAVGVFALGWIVSSYVKEIHAAGSRTFAASQRRVSLVISAVVGILITAGAIFGSFYKVTSPTILAPWFALGLLGVGFASTWVLRARRSASTELTDLSAKSVST